MKLEELKGEKREADRQNSRLKQEVDSLQAEVDGRTGGRGDTAAGEVMQLQEVVSSMESELSDMRASNDALKSEILRLQAQLGGGEDERKLEAKLREAKKKQHAFAGQQIVDESVDMTGKAVDAIMESFLMPRKAMDMAVEVERKKEQAKTGLTFA